MHAHKTWIYKTRISISIVYKVLYIMGNLAWLLCFCMNRRENKINNNSLVKSQKGAIAIYIVQR